MLTGTASVLDALMMMQGHAGREWMMYCWIHKDSIDDKDIHIKKCVFCPLF